jgi:endonuclease I
MKSNQADDRGVSRFRSLRFLTTVIVIGLGGMAVSVPATPLTTTGTFTFGPDGNVAAFAYNGRPVLNLSVGDLTKVGVTTSSSAGNFRASTWPLDGSPIGSLTGAPDPGKYFEFTLTADPGVTFDLDSITFGFGRSGTGPRSAQWRSSLDDYAAPIGSYSSLGASGLFGQADGALNFLTDSTATTGTNVVLALSGSSAGYRGLSTLGLRWYGYNAEATGGTGGFQGPLSFTVTVRAVEPSGPYDPPPGYYATATGTGSVLKSQLHSIIDDQIVFSYADARSILQVTDADPASPGHMLLVYDRVSLDVAAIDPDGPIPGWDGGVSWNREHTWPESRGLVVGGPEYTDLHNLRPSTPSVNSARGNKNFGGAYGQPFGAVNDEGALWYPGDADAGMIARQEFYMATRYDGSDTAVDLKLLPGNPSDAQGLGDLIRMVEWHYQAVPDEFELRRNQVIFADYQRNRNPYVDRPEFVWSVFVNQENDSQLYVGAAPAVDGSSSLEVDLGRVIVGGSLPAAQGVELHRNGFDGTYFEVTASGSAVSSINGRFNAFPLNTTGTASRIFDVGLDASTAAAGLQSGTVTIRNLDITTEGGVGRGANDAADLITVSLAVLDHATPSFLAGGTSDMLTLDFGTLLQGGPTHTLSFDIFNRAGGLGSQWTAALDLDGIVQNDPSGVFTSTLAPFTDLPAGLFTSATVSMATAVVGSFSGSLLLNFSDEDLPGATSSSMTVSLLGTVVVPEPATVVLVVASLAVMAWRRRRWLASRPAHTRQ